MFAKVFQSMYDGSLGTRGPWEALVTFQQMLVLSDRFGDVDMTAEVIARRTLIPITIIQKGIAELLKHDPESRDPSNDGRRIIQISENRDWGWNIVNYTRYSAIRSAEERRMYKASYYREKIAAPKAPANSAKKAVDGFQAFYDAYPRHTGRANAEKAWNKLAPTLEVQNVILEAVAKQKASVQWQDQQFIPHPATWLNGKRWGDELLEPAGELQPSAKTFTRHCRKCGTTEGNSWIDGLCSPCWEAR